MGIMQEIFEYTDDTDFGFIHADWIATKAHQNEGENDRLVDDETSQEQPTPKSATVAHSTIQAENRSYGPERFEGERPGDA